MKQVEHQKKKTKSWWSDEKVDQFEAFPILYVYSIWEARNKAIFNNTWVPPDIVNTLLLNKIQEHKKDSIRHKTRAIREPKINKEMPWAFFDGASQGDPPLGGVGAVIFFFATKKKKIKYAMGHASNNKEEFSALWATLRVAQNSQI